MIKPQTIFTGDNLDIMRGMESESVDLIYLDPPFNSNRFYSAPIGSKAAGAAFKDTWTVSDTDDAWWGEIADEHPSLYKVIDAAGEVGGGGNKSYLIYIAMRLLEMRRLLKNTGSLYLHCDPTMSHSIKLTMDAIFGERYFRNEILWVYNRFSRRGQGYPSMNDVLLFYSQSEKITFNDLYTDPKDTKRYEKGYHTVVDSGVKKLLVYDAKKAATKIGEAQKQGIKVAFTQARSPRLGNVWTDIPIINPQAKERTGYPTQKPLALLERIVKASSNEGDIVFDPFCGCATTLIAAQKLKRHWIGIDISPVAVRLVKDRLENELGLFAKFIHRTDIPTRKKECAPSLAVIEG